MCDFLFVCDSNVCYFCRRLRDIDSREVPDLGRRLWNGLMSNVNNYANRKPICHLFLLAIAMFAISVTVYELITYELPDVFDRFESFTLILRSRMSGFDENWHMILFCQHAYV